MLRKLDSFDYFYFFIVVIYAAMALPTTKSMIKPGGDFISYIIPWGFTLLICLKHKVNFLNKSLLNVTLIYFTWAIFQIIKQKTFYDGVFLFYGNILLAFILIKIYGTQLFFLYEKTVIALSVVAIFGWFCQIIMPGFIKTIMFATSISDFSSDRTILANNIIFSLTNDTRFIQEGYLIPRNSGFSWEPGRYASMAIFAMFFNLLRSNFKIKGNKGFWILFIAIISTQSTTGISALLLLISFYIINKRAKIRMMLLIFILIPLLAVAFYFPFMGDKISDLWFDQNNVERVSHSAQYRENGDRSIVPQRFTGMLFELMNLKSDPILGYGIGPEDSFVQTKISPFISLPGGTFKILTQFGLVLGLLVYYSLYRSSLVISQIYGFKANWNLFIVFIILSTSYSFWDVPIYSSIWLFSIFGIREVDNIYQKNYA